MIKYTKITPEILKELITLIVRHIKFKSLLLYIDKE